jgi:hypothetical protein
MDWIAYVRREGPVLFETIILSRARVRAGQRRRAHPF